MMKVEHTQSITVGDKTKPALTVNQTVVYDTAQDLGTAKTVVQALELGEVARIKGMLAAQGVNEPVTE